MVAAVFAPQWEGPVKRWAIKFIRRNQWRVERINEFDDLLQDACLIFCKVASRYTVVEARHFMALFQRAMANSYHDKAKYLKRKREACFADNPPEIDFDRIIGEASNSGYLNALIAEAPDELRCAISAFDDPITCAAIRRRPRKTGRHRKRENLNMRLRRVTGACDGTDLVGGIRDLLT